MANGPVKRGKSSAMIDKRAFKRKAKHANSKIAPLPRAKTKFRITPLPNGTETAADHIKSVFERRQEHKSVPQWKKDRRNRMFRKDI